MANFSTAVDIRAAPERVAAVLFDVERWPEWTSTVTSSQRLDPGPFAVGSRARVRQPKLAPAIWRVAELDPMTGFLWVSQTPGLRMTAGHRIAASGEGSRVTLSFQFSGLLGPLVARIYRGLIKRYLAIEAAGLKGRCEDAK